MKIRLFGKDLFEFNTRSGENWAVPALAKVAKMDRLPDFHTIGKGGSWDDGPSGWINSNMTVTATAVIDVGEKPKKEKAKLTPRRVYDLRMLHDKAFQLNTEPAYVDGQIADFKAKLALMGDQDYNHRGADEIGSILIRMENRKKYAKERATFEKYPYTTGTRIDGVLKKHDNLQLGQIDQFVADMPNEATQAMKEYNYATNKLCGKKAVFYIIAEQKDFQKTASRRDPILLAQSPFGHFWQILGAWDKEMLFLEEL